MNTYKGKRKFLEDKYIRLGIPFVIYMFGLGPLLIYLNWMVIGEAWNEYIRWYTGPCWFLAWLLIFNTIYATFGHHIPIYKASFPSFKLMFFIGIVSGLLQRIIYLAIFGDFIFMPIGWGSLPFDILFFTCGIIGKRNNWLNNGINVLSRNGVYVLRALTILGSIWIIVMRIVFYIYDTGIMIPHKNATDNCDDAGDVGIDAGDDNRDNNVITITFDVLMGLMTVVISLTILQFGYQYLNFSNKYTKFHASHAYTVYIIHPLIVTPIGWSYLKILPIIGGNEPYFCSYSINSKSNIGGDIYLWVGFIYTSILAMIVLYPIAWIIKKLPGLRHIL